MTGTNSTGRSPSDSLVIDRIIYLASLVSDPKAIDQRLDTLRAVTAQATPGTPLTQDNHRALATLEEELTQYLINKDPVRSFSVQSLQADLDRQFSNKRPFSASKQLGLLASLTALIYLASAFLIPGHAGLERRLLLAMPIPAAFMNGIIAWFFWSARQNFAKSISRMYETFSMASIVCAFVSVQMPILFAIPRLRQHDAFGYIAFLPPFVIVFASFYIGMYLYTQQLGLAKNKWLSPLASFLIPSLLAAGVIFSYQPTSGSIPFFDLSVATNIIDAYLCIPTVLLAFKVMSHVTSRYAQSVRLFAWGVAGLVISCIVSLLVLFGTSGPTTATGIGIVSTAFAIPEVYILASAYIAKRNATERTEREEFALQ